jgi:uncharacterized sulfatase
MSAPRQIIVIMTDTQRTDWLGCYGYPDIKTPNIDSIAEQGMRFTNAYTCQPVCGPARAALFTGTYPHSCGSWSNSIALGDNVKTIGQRLTDNQVHCGYIGKWHLDGSDYFGLGRCPEGWDPDYWYDMRNYLEEFSDEDRLRTRNAQTCYDDDFSEEMTYGHRCTDRANAFLEKSANEDFFLAVSYDEPHHPFLCPPEFFDMYRDYEIPKRPNVWDTLKNKPEHQRVWAGDAIHEDKDALKVADVYKRFLGCNSYVDYEIGRLLASIEKHAPDALIIYTSDHGDHAHSHSLHNKGATMYEENVNIPFLVKCPGLVPAHTVSDAPVSHVDIVPTVLEHFGIPTPKLLEGNSLMPGLEDPTVRVNEEVFVEFGRYEVDHDGFGGFQPIRCVCDGRYKLAINLLSSDELYDLEDDPYEMTNLIDSTDHAKKRDALHDRLLDWMNETRDPFRGYYWQRRPWRTDAPAAQWEFTRKTRQRENEEYEPRQLDYGTGLPMEEAVRGK